MHLDFSSGLYIFGLSAVFIFAITGALSAVKRELDILGFMLVGTVTGIGGGTLRDVLLQGPKIFWIEDPTYLVICIFGSLATYFFAHWMVRIDRFLLWFDGAGIALFAVLGTQKALLYGVSPLVAVIMGVITSTIGSVIRDVMLQQNVIIFEPEIYVSACLFGSTLYVALAFMSVDPVYAVLIASTCAFILRICAIEFDLRFSHYKLSKVQNRAIEKHEDSLQNDQGPAA